MTDAVLLHVVLSRYGFLHGLCLCDRIHAEKSLVLV